MAPLRIGVIGAARIARAFVEGVRGSDNAVVSAIASRKRETAEAFAREFGVAKVYAPYEALLADPDIDAIYNPLPNGLHAEWSIRAAEAGKHVLCEKPLAVSADEARAMFVAAERCGVRIVEAYPYLAQPQTLRLRELIAEGEIGALRTIQASFGFTLTRPRDVRLDPALGAGALLDTGCYPVSLVRVLAGAAPARVSAAATWLEPGVDRTLAATLEHADGLLAQISCSFAAADHRCATIVGESGVIETNYWNHTSPERPARLRVKRGLGPSPAFEDVMLAEADGFRAETDAFADLVAGRPDAWTGASKEQSIDIAATLDAIAASARSGQPVEVARA